MKKVKMAIMIQIHQVMDIAHEGFNYSDEEMIFLMLDITKSTEVIL